MFKSETETAGFADPENGGNARSVDALPHELRALLDTISRQIGEADDRHTALLVEMKERLISLNAQAERLRADIAAGPAPLKSAAPAQPSETANDTYRAAALTNGIDPFDVIGEPDGDEPARAWNSDDAEALTRIYEESDAALLRSAVGVTPASRIEQEEHKQTEPNSLADFAPTTSQIDDERTFDSLHPNPAAQTPSWIEDRLSQIARRLEQSLAELRQQTDHDTLAERFVALETRLAGVLEDVATRADVEGLAALQAHIQELAAHVERAEAQLVRLDTIERQLEAVIEHLSETQPFAAVTSTPSSHDQPDFATLAKSIADETAQRMTSAMPPAEADPRIEQMTTMLRGLIDDRRQNDEQTYTMLDTVQQALIRLLDRIDSLEVAQAKILGARGTNDGPLSAATAMPDAFGQPSGQTAAADVPVIPAGGAARFTEPAGGLSTPHVAPAARAPDFTADGSPATDTAPTRSVTDMARQDFIAEARRAKLRAAAAAAETPELAKDGSAAARALPRPKLAVNEAPAAPSSESTHIGSSRRMKMTAIALGVVVALTGGALLLKSNTRTPRAPEPAATTSAPEMMRPEATNAAAPAPANLLPKAPSELQTESSTALEGPSTKSAHSDPSKPVPANGQNPAVAPQAPAGAQPNGKSAPRTSIPEDSGDILTPTEEMIEGELMRNGAPGASPAIIAGPEGIVLQESPIRPTPQQIAHIRQQQSTATLSSQLAEMVGRLEPSDLMPEVVASLNAHDSRTDPVSDFGMPDDTSVDGTVGMTPAAIAQPASLTPDPDTATQSAPTNFTSDPFATNGATRDKAPGAGSTMALALPPATVGPLSLRIAASKGDPSAAFEVGARLAEGRGTNQDFKEAVVWYQRSASQGFAQAQYRLGTLYERGLGVKADLNRARSWYQRAAEQGNVKAMHNLAVLSAGREQGTPDYTTAAQWFQSAAEYGLADSQYNLAVLFENGLGVPRDDRQAYKWYALAANAGDKEAAKRRDEVARRLSPDALEEAQIVARAFVPKRTEPLVNDARVAGEDWKRREAMDDNG